MSAPLSPTTGCCAPACSDQTIVQVPGPKGDKGDPGVGTKGDKGDQGIQGIQGIQGVPGPGNTLNSVSPTTTRGDLIVDNGANNPAASDVRLAAGADGKVLAADSTQPTGLNYVTVQPNTVANDKNIPRFSGTTGKPVPLQDSKLLITDDGAIQSTPTGGNARGTKATDLQVDRAVITQVASGANATIVGGKNNTASAANSAAICGSGNTASNTNAFVGGGETNIASGLDAAVCGGGINTASGSVSFVGGGSQNIAAANNAAVAGGTINHANSADSFIGGGDTNTISEASGAILGGSNNTINAGAQYAAVLGGAFGVAYLYGQIVSALGIFANAGDAQVSQLIFRNRTTDATANVEAFLDGPAGSARAVIPLNNTWAFCIYVCGRSSAGVSAAWKIEGAIQNVANTVALVSAVTTTVIADGTGGTWGLAGNVVVDADNTHKSLRVRMTGAAVTTIRWMVSAQLTELNF